MCNHENTKWLHLTPTECIEGDCSVNDNKVCPLAVCVDCEEEVA